jgi:hypothetical protein
MKRPYPCYVVYRVVLIVLVLMITGCSGSSGTPNPPESISVALSPQPPSSTDTGSIINLTAVVSNDGANAGVKWSVTCGSSQCGSFSTASTASGTTTKFTAPASAPKPATVAVTATSVTDSTKSASATITISVPSAPITVTLNSPPASLAATTSGAFTATVANDSASAGVTWSVTCGSAQCGSFNPATTPSGTATAYTAPAAPPTPATVTVTATSVADTTKSASASVTITAAPPVLADGNYVYHLAGEDGTSPYFVAGAFTVQNGVMTAGEQDMTDANTIVQDNLTASGSSLSLVNGNIQIVLNTGDTAIGVNGIETFRGTVVSSARVLISEFDTFATATGSIDQQTSTAAPAGGYAFNLGGLDGAAQPSNLAVGGILNISGASVTAGNSVFDYNDGGNIGQAQTFASGTVSAPDSFGRVVFTLNPTASTGVPSFAVAGYTVGTNQIQLVETNDTLGGDLGGTALGQGSNTGQFNLASVAGGSYAFGANGQDNTSAGSNIVQMAGAFGLNADGNVSGDIALNDLNFSFGSQITSGTYTVDPNGRVTLTATISSNQISNHPTFTFQLYLDGNGNALELGVDSLQITSGLSYLQQASSADFEGNYALNVYGFSSINQEPAWAATGPVTVASDAFSGYTDSSVQNAANSASIVTPGVPLSGSETSSTGVLTLTGLNALDPETPSGFGYYPIDDRRVIAIELDNQQTNGMQMGLMMLEGVQPN